MQYSCTYTHDDEESGEQWIVRVDFDIDPGERGCHTQRNGDPGWPEIPAHICDETYTVLRWTAYDENGYERAFSLNPGPVYDGKFLAMVEADENLRERIETACWESLPSEEEDLPYGFDEVYG